MLQSLYLVSITVIVVTDEVHVVQSALAFDCITVKRRNYQRRTMKYDGIYISDCDPVVHC